MCYLGMNLHAQSAHMLCDDGRGSEFLITELWVLMEVSSPGHYVGHDGVDPLLYVGR